jgi:Protein of unknown function (DUF2934)
MKDATMSKPEDTKIITPPEAEERIRTLAYQMWEDEGRPEGRAEAHWEQACLVVMNMDAEAPEWLARKPEKTVEPPRVDTQKRVEELAQRTIRRSAA